MYLRTWRATKPLMSSPPQKGGGGSRSQSPISLFASSRLLWETLNVVAKSLHESGQSVTCEDKGTEADLNLRKKYDTRAEPISPSSASEPRSLSSVPGRESG